MRTTTAVVVIGTALLFMAWRMGRPTLLRLGGRRQ
jgi:hypothetical protein